MLKSWGKQEKHNQFNVCRICLILHITRFSFDNTVPLKNCMDTTRIKERNSYEKKAEDINVTTMILLT